MYLGNSKSVSFTNLNPGDYHLTIQGANEDYILGPKLSALGKLLKAGMRKRQFTKFNALAVSEIFNYIWPILSFSALAKTLKLFTAFSRPW
jgi:hypothetical protein